MEYLGKIRKAQARFQQLRCPERQRASELAKEFAVPVRTIYRWLAVGKA